MVLADTGDLDVSGFLTIRQPSLAIVAVGLDEAAPALSAQFEGLLLAANVPFQLRGQLGGSPAFALTPLSGDLLVTSEQVLDRFLGAVVPQFPSLPVTDLQLNADFEAEDYTLSASLSGTWTIPLGVSPPAVSGLSITVRSFSGGVEGRIEGRLTLGGQQVSIRAQVPGEFVLSGDLAPLGLTDLVGSVAGPVLRIPPGIPTLRLEASRFFVRFDGAAPSLALRTTVAGFGTVMVLVVQVGDDWNAIAAFVPPDDWTFARLASALAPLDALQIRQPRLEFASFSADDFPIPEIEGVAFGRRLSRGIQLDATLKLGGRGLDLVAGLIGLSELPLRLAVESDLAQAEAEATLGRAMELVLAVLVLENLAVAIRPSPLSIALRAEARVVIEGEVLPRFRIGIALSEGAQRVVFETTEPWVKPFGISGLTVNQVVLDVQTAPAPLYGILGDVAVAGRQIRIACQFAGSAPSALIGELQGRLSLGEVIKDLVGLSLPPVLDLSIEDFSLHIVSNPLGATIGSEHFDPGLSLRGTLGILGLEMLVNVRIRPESGVFAQGALKGRVAFGNVLVLSDAAGTGPPSMTLDTAGSPLLRITGRVVLLGLSETLDATVDRTGFAVTIAEDLGIARYDLAVVYESAARFRAQGSFAFGLRASIPTDLGTIVLDTGLNGQLTVSMTDGQFELVADGSFTFVGNTLRAPTVRLTAAIDSLEDLPDRVRDLVADRVAEVFRAILEDPARWVQAIASDATREVENVARVLRDRFQKDADFIGRQLKTVLGQSSVEVAQALKGIGEAPERIAGVLRDLGDNVANVRNALERIGVPAGQIGGILSGIFNVPHLDQVIHGDVHTDTPIIPPLQLHVDTPIIPPVRFHADEQAAPHADAHTDTPIVPPVRIHLDTSATPHVDAHVDSPGPHGDVHSDVHGDAHGDALGIRFHTDTHGGPHTDFSGPHADAHSDVRGQGHLDAHTDTPRQGHGDIHIDTSARIHVDAHTDTPGQGHGDIHTDTPEQGHADVHGDTAVHADAP